MSTPPVSMPDSLHHSWVDGQSVPGRGGTRPVRNPATGAAFAEVSLLDGAQAADAIGTARAAFPAWSARSFAERAQVLLAVRDRLLAEADEIAALIGREQGKPPGEAHAVEIFPALECLRHLAERAEEILHGDLVESEVLLFVHKECRLAYVPYGVVLSITPWNYPFGISMTSVAAAAMAGNTVVLKPAPATTLVGLKLGELFVKAGAPAGVVNVIAVDDVHAPALVADPRVAKIVFTGSVATGRRVMETAARNLTPVVLELGGKDPAVVCADADLDRAAQGVVWGAFVNTGQTCASVERVYVEASVAEAFTAKVVEHTRKLKVGDAGADPTVDVGPLTMDRQRKIVSDHVDDALARGATALTGGALPPGDGFFYPPTVLTGVTQDMKVMRDETFGPVLPILAVKDVDEAIRLANDSDYALTASGWTRSEETAERLQKELQAGVVTINDCVSSYGEPSAPWGGLKWSGVGRTHGLAGLREMVQVKYVTADWSRRAAPWWYPYGADLGPMASTLNRAIHSRSFFARIAAQLQLLKFSRLWKRANLGSILAHFDKLF